MSASSKGKPKAPTNTVSDAPPIASSSSTPTRPRPDTRGGDDPHPAKRARIATAPNPSRARKSKTTDIPSPCTSIQKNRLPLASRLNSAHPSLEELQMPDADASPLHKDSVLEPSNVGLAETDITRLSAAAARTELPGDIEMSDTGFFPLHEMSKLAKLNSAVPFVNPCRAETDQDVEMLVTDSLPLHETRNTLSEPLLPAWNPEKDAASTSLSNKRTGSTPGEEHRNEQMNTELENVELTVSDVHQTPKRVIVKTKRRSDRAGVKTQSRPHHLDWTQGGLVQVIPTGVTHVDKLPLCETQKPQSDRNSSAFWHPFRLVYPVNSAK
ncbi:hypothetical protein FB45DRAFT_860778 [Roridomyces roridus]|uniref:Uncharacterized protein n=1 Tax=Roridomyces roridus TaxID=1738132 RepID=A0AAD7CFV1_9AGAR|nr:hypothetical protein FB45DRAFT_860778 [Roridomyces roridus]